MLPLLLLSNTGFIIRSPSVEAGAICPCLQSQPASDHRGSLNLFTFHLEGPQRNSVNTFVVMVACDVLGK